MNDEQLDKIFANARAAKSDTSRTEFGFETRLLARLRAERQNVPWFVFAWRLMPVFAAIVVALGVWSYTGFGSADLGAAIADDADETLLALHLTGETP